MIEKHGTNDIWSLLRLLASVEKVSSVRMYKIINESDVFNYSYSEFSDD